MKPIVNVVGSFVEGRNGGVILNGWGISGEKADEAFTIQELKEMAITNNSYQLVEGIAPDTDRGIRWFGDDPFGV